MKQDKEFTPEWGKEYEFKNSDQAWRKAKFIAMDVNKPNEYLAQPDSGYIISFEHIRPITKTMEEEIRELIKTFNIISSTRDQLIQSILEIFSRHNQPVMPSDEEIIQYYANHKFTGENDTSLIATVKHFLTTQLKK